MTHALKSDDTINLDERDERARRAVKVFRSLQPTLTAYARALSRRTDVRVEMSTSSNGSTDGKRIFFRPPIDLSDIVEHQRNICDRRGPDKRLLCPACEQREMVLVPIYHEIAHICFDTMAQPDDADKIHTLEESVKFIDKRFAEHYRIKLEKASRYEKRSYLSLAGAMSKWLPIIFNALEDARVNQGHFKARSGTKVMFDAQTAKIFAEGVETRDPATGEVIYKTWDTANQNMQFIIGLFCKASGYAYSDWFIPPVVEALDDAEITKLTNTVPTLRSARNTYELVFPVLIRAKELGFCLEATDPQPEPEPDENPEEAEEAEEPENPDESDISDDPSSSSEQGDSDDENTEDDSGTDVDDSGDDSEESGSEGDPDSDESGSDSNPDGGPGSGDAPTGESDPEGHGDESGSEDDDGADESGAGRSDESDDDLEDSLDDGDLDPSYDPGDEGESDPSESSAGDGDQSDGDGGEVHSDEQPPEGEPDSRDDDSTGQPEAGDPDLSEVDGDGDASSDAGGTANGDPGDSESGDESEGSDDVPRENVSPIPGEESSPEAVDARADGDSAVGSESAESIDEDGNPIDTGADEGRGGTEVIEKEEYDSIPMGEPEDCEVALVKWSGHEDPPITVEEEKRNDAAVEKAILQGFYFETPSRNIVGVLEHHYDQHIYQNGRDRSTAWTGGSYWGSLSGITTGKDSTEEYKPAESALGRVLLKMRVAFSDNQRADHQRHRKSGKVDARILGKRAWSGDERLFKVKRLPGKRDYFVLIGIDISGSTLGVNLDLAKRSAFAQAELCHRMGVKFAIYCHSGSYHNQAGGREDGFDLDIYHIKSAEEPWSTEIQNRLIEIHPDQANLDGHTIEYYRKVCDTRPETDKIILYFSDGKMPAENHDEELEILKREITTCRRKGYLLLGVGIRTDSPARHGLETVQVDEIGDLVKVVDQLGSKLAVKR
jgi:hypothetical protein